MARQAKAGAAGATKAAPEPVERAGPKRERAPFYVSADVLEKCRDVVYWTPGLTMADLAENALKRELARLERERGEVFPRRAGELKAGRPVGSKGR